MQGRVTLLCTLVEVFLYFGFITIKREIVTTLALIYCEKDQNLCCVLYISSYHLTYTL
jgi:hypothetical protein